MITQNRDIIFTLISSDEEIKIATYEGEVRNLMTLINEKIYVEDFGECRGIGRCGTCLVQVKGLGNEASVMDRNEKSTLSKVVVKNLNLRLSCQIMIDSSLQNSTIRIVEEREDVR
ncbi:MAG: 2Fe-2S iron-sulfur cluster-binding protein [Ginsengibacter sp.]